MAVCCLKLCRHSQWGKDLNETQHGIRRHGVQPLTQAAAQRLLSGLQKFKAAVFFRKLYKYIEFEKQEPSAGRVVVRFLTFWLTILLRQLGELSVLACAMELASDECGSAFF